MPLFFFLRCSDRTVIFADTLAYSLTQLFPEPLIFALEPTVKGLATVLSSDS